MDMLDEEIVALQLDLARVRMLIERLQVSRLQIGCVVQGDTQLEVLDTQVTPNGVKVIVAEQEDGDLETEKGESSQ